MIEIKELNNTSFADTQYSEFLREYNKERTAYKYEQYKWYQKRGEYVIVVAVVDGNLAGQASAYRCTACCGGVNLPIYWGCDTFVLPKYRGLGLGKKLQKYLHEHAENFSSAGYTPLNGIIKRKCGAHELFINDFIYYPMSNLANFIVRKVASKWLAKDVRIPCCKFPIYYFLNKKKYKEFNIGVEQYERIRDEVLTFIENTLSSQYDFYVIRDREYMQWKYVENPSMTYKMLTVRKGRQLSAVIFFTDVFLCELSGVKLHLCKLLDSIIDKDSGFTQKDALLCVMGYWESKKEYLDGIASMFRVPYVGKIGFKRPMLSMLQEVNITSPYMSYSDQDLEQMR